MEGRPHDAVQPGGGESHAKKTPEGAHVARVVGVGVELVREVAGAADERDVADQIEIGPEMVRTKQAQKRTQEPRMRVEHPGEQVTLEIGRREGVLLHVEFSKRATGMWSGGVAHGRGTRTAREARGSVGMGPLIAPIA